MSTIQSIIHVGTNGIVIEAECHISNGLPAVVIVGLGNKAVEESKERMRSAFANSALVFPRKRITINLAPADIPKDSTSIDLAIAAAILKTSDQLVSNQNFNATAFIGELGLDGGVRSVRGIIGKILAGKKNGIDTFYIPPGNLKQALLIPQTTIVPVESLSELRKFMAMDKPACPIPANFKQAINPPINSADHFANIAGQQQAKRALEIAAAGGHNILLSGPPGTGKSMLAKTLPSILPPLSEQEMLEVTHLHSLTSNEYENLVTSRPFRAPHHSASHIAIVGGGNSLRPGEVTLSHRGVLFLDELPEFNRATLEALRQPLEDRTITISRAKNTIVYPANFTLVATANPCPCGFYGTGTACECSAATILRYQQRLSGPILDRIDICVNMERVDHSKLLKNEVDKGDLTIPARIANARNMQFKRQKNLQVLNASMDNGAIKAHALLVNDAEILVNNASASLGLSARGYMKTIKVARTIADLENSKKIHPQHISEALQYRYRPPNQNRA